MKASMVCASLVVASVEAVSNPPTFDYDPSSSGVQGPTSLVAPSQRAFRPHSLEVRACAAQGTAYPFFAPYVPIPFPLCGGEPVLTLQFVLDERVVRATGETGPRSGMTAFVLATNPATGQFEYVISSFLPITAIEIEEKAGRVSYALEVSDMIGATTRFDIATPSGRLAYVQDPVRGTDSNPVRIRSLGGGPAFLVARAGYRATFPATSSNVTVQLGKAGVISFSEGVLGVGQVLGAVTVDSPGEYQIQVAP